MPDRAVEILLVEDNPDDVEFFLHTCAKAGLTARLHTVRDGAEALDFIFGSGDNPNRNSSRRPKVIILDLKLPKVDGLAVLQRLKSDPHTRCIPVVVLSSSQEERDLIRSYELGANSYVVKPMDFDEFGHSIQMLGRLAAVQPPPNS